MSVDIDEFLTESEEVVENEPEEIETEDLDVQKAVVEALAADKAAQDEKIKQLESANEAKSNEIIQLKAEIADLKQKIEQFKESLEKVGDVLATNTERPGSNQVSLLDRNPEIDDRFAGETRDQVLEVLREGREAAEKTGRARRAQLLEAVLVSNEPSGNLAKHRAALEKLFSDNGNLMSGAVIEELKKMGIAHKHGEEYLLPSEIINRTY